ncbi:hypothetical protein PILCRDRAFT_308713 [Piloderma croceum F 1598]|uniref:Cytochrome P450 n=1 Tax=Piloderma croceum (strain F 1598) TaxID=765440 RepID=A0A0C3CA45_PILCF|nr:hypothetical protein PILCRDRAFT_308713 [Piloderma croceum F 1598]
MSLSSWLQGSGFVVLPNTATFAGIVGIIFLLIIWSRTPTHLGNLPPGPKPVYALGNIRDLTSKELWLRARDWARQYGSVCYLHILGQGLVFLNTPEAAVDLMDKRGTIYSDKPQLVMVGELCGCKDMVAFVPYGDQSKRQRKLMQQALGPSSIREYRPLIEAETISFMRRLLDDPIDYINLTRRYAGGLTLFVIYGHEVKSNDDTFLTMAEKCIWLLSNRIASSGGIWPVDIFPFLKYIPTWVPGMAFKRNAIQWKAEMEEFVDKPYNFVRSNIKAGTALSSFCKTLLDGDREIKDQELFDIKWTANSMYAASIETSITLVAHFILAMISHPEVVAKAQKEIDTIIGNERLPNFSDRTSLPYIENIMSECLRWAAPVPLGLPHRLMEDDVYENMFIPKGSLIIANIWTILRNEALYPNPDVFYPDRFMEKVDQQTERRRDPRNYVFGFGRRYISNLNAHSYASEIYNMITRHCPGSHLIESSMWLLMVTMLATFDMSKSIDEYGHTIDPDVQFNDSVFRIPSAFKCSLMPRSEQMVRLIRQ